MLKNSSLTLIFVSAVAGLMAAVFSLIAGAVFGVSSETNLTPAGDALLVVIEEVIKFLVLIFLFSTSSQFEEKIKIFLATIFFSLGFGLLELWLLTFEQTSLTFSMALVFLVHWLSSLILSFAIYFQRKNNWQWITLVGLLLAIIFHVCYNLVVLNLNQ